MEEAYSLRYYVYPRVVKMYHDLNQDYLCCRKKRYIVDYVFRCLNCQQVKYEHQRPSGMSQRMPILSGSGSGLPLILWYDYRRIYENSMVKGHCGQIDQISSFCDNSNFILCGEVGKNLHPGDNGFTWCTNIYHFILRYSVHIKLLEFYAKGLGY
ncbi:hypothetical protein MTR67_051707 [Solanum verrucosum]|uniref:Uncharacterized protein n=1 Tax=Solanum verrucosum TaxID=315347 RepID=A0AAF0ZZC1_SOLVR|nr:hypothetical protein MTR67_051707 [Solanum verrucosum]